MGLHGAGLHRLVGGMGQGDMGVHMHCGWGLSNTLVFKLPVLPMHCMGVHGPELHGPMSPWAAWGGQSEVRGVLHLQLNGFAWMGRGCMGRQGYAPAP